MSQGFDQSNGELADVRIVVAAAGIAASYCAKLLGDAGADVVLVEPTGGHPLRAWNCAQTKLSADGALFRFFHHGHQSVVDRDEALIASADVVIVDGQGPFGTIDDIGDLAAADSGQVVVSITPWGLHGPYTQRPWSELVIQAEGGSVGSRGRPDSMPLQMGGHVTEWVTGAYAAVGALAALRVARRDGRGDLVDVSMLEVCNVSSNLFADLTDCLRGRPDLALSPPPRSYETPSIEPTLDGYVGVNTNTRSQFEAFLLMIERADLLDDPAWATVGARYLRWDEWNEIVHHWTTRHTTAEIVELAAALRIPVAPVADAQTLLGVDHIVERGVYIDDPTGAFKMPRRPWTIDQEPAPPPRPAPALGADTDRIGPHSRLAAAVPATTTNRPSAGAANAALNGVRILDMTAWWAGPSCTAMLGALGADVIHVESTGYPDGIRLAGGIFIDRPSWWELSSIFLQANTNKRDVTLDLVSARGRELLLELVAQCDVVVENFTPRVLEQFNLDWDVIHAANPKAVMVRMPAFGLDGPWRDRPGFAQTMEQVTGLAWMTGFADDQPRIQRGPCDPNAGMHAALATMVALDRRDRTGQGCFVEVPMVEAALNVAAESVIEWTVYANPLGRDGNRSPRAAPQGVYACAGAEQWLALSVQTNDDWLHLCEVVGNSVWVNDPGLSTPVGRRERHDEIDDFLHAWAASRDVQGLVAQLCAAGVPAGRVIDPRRASEHPQLIARGFFEVVDHPIAGPITVPGVPFRMRGIQRWIQRATPTLGQHNQEILGGLVGCSGDELELLTANQVIGTRPRGQ